MNLSIPPGLAKEIADKIGCKTDLAVPFIEHALENALLFDAKQLDYGTGNISGFGILGCMIRANDKHERLKTLLFSGGRKRKAKNESVVDSYRDISNYMVIALMITKGQWPGIKEDK